MLGLELVGTSIDILVVLVVKNHLINSEILLDNSSISVLSYVLPSLGKSKTSIS